MDPFPFALNVHCQISHPKFSKANDVLFHLDKMPVFPVLLHHMNNLGYSISNLSNFTNKFKSEPVLHTVRVFCTAASNLNITYVVLFLPSST